MSWPRFGLFGRAVQLEISLEPPARDGASLLARLRAMGLQGLTAYVLTTNRTVMVSYRHSVLRVHEGYLGAPPDVLRAIVAFVHGRSRRARRAAERVILAHAPQAPERPADRHRRREPRVRREDAPLVAELVRRHEELNWRHFGGALRAIPIRVSGRMRSRLGQYAAALDRVGAEITISRSHIRRHGWTEALETLLHEMVHQWQAEQGLPLDHGATFRAKAREVGIEPRARRATVRAEAGHAAPGRSIPKYAGSE